MARRWVTRLRRCVVSSHYNATLSRCVVLSCSVSTWLGHGVLRPCVASPHSDVELCRCAVSPGCVVVLCWCVLSTCNITTPSFRVASLCCLSLWHIIVVSRDAVVSRPYQAIISLRHPKISPPIMWLFRSTTSTFCAAAWPYRCYIAAFGLPHLRAALTHHAVI
jgi:hypothetical protein